ncbi:MAG: DUF92 domain-containing protein [Candidatus Methanoplasma sp.]|jgi:uncharacterized protein (TIGR00297 family)|nr:DUF92 domain-containing protein [Candidatus Methanoplasma sp.]
MTQMIISGILSAALAFAAYQFRMLTLSGAIASFFVGYIVGIFGTIEWLILLVAFTFAGLIATKMDMNDKAECGLQEGNFGERSHKNVLGVGIPACIFAILYGTSDTILTPLLGALPIQYNFALTVAFITTLTVAAADTVASEIGIRDKRVWLITTFERVKRGTNGGVSVLGTASSAAAAVFTGVVGWLLIFKGLDILVVVPIVFGIMGNLLDSVLGATLERKGKITKYANNCLSALSGAVLGFAVILLL